jgi:hypothetical protein
MPCRRGAVDVSIEKNGADADDAWPKNFPIDAKISSPTAKTSAARERCGGGESMVGAGGTRGIVAADVCAVEGDVSCPPVPLGVASPTSALRAADSISSTGACTAHLGDVDPTSKLGEVDPGLEAE